jgi:hypothetical protein
MKVNRAPGIFADAPLEAGALRMMLAARALHASVGGREFFKHAGRHDVFALAGVRFTPIKLDAKMRAACPTIYARIPPPHTLLYDTPLEGE